MERALVELLVSVDDETLRQTIISQLENEPIKRLDWMTTKYHGNTVAESMGGNVAELAGSKGNLGLLKWLLAQPGSINIDTLDKTLKSAVRSGKNYH